MEVIALLALLGIGAGFMLFDVNSQSGDEDEPDPDDDYLVSGDETVVGSIGADLFLRDPDETSFQNSSVEAGAGDDTIALYDPETDGDDPYAARFTNTTIDAGPGDDHVDIFAERSIIYGGDGNDTINSYRLGDELEVYGGNGDDLLVGEAEDGAAAILDGGAGNDTIDVRGMVNVYARGGEGDDLIHIAGVRDSGAGFVPLAQGGDGDDTISYVGGGITSTHFDPTFISGGAGSDTFELSLNEGALELGDRGEDIPVETSDDGTLRLSAIELSDYDPGTDILTINADSLNQEFTLATARIETVAAPGGTTTQLVLRYEGDTEPDRDVVIDLGEVAVTLAQIQFTGSQVPTLMTT